MRKPLRQILTSIFHLYRIVAKFPSKNHHPKKVKCLVKKSSPPRNLMKNSDEFPIQDLFVFFYSNKVSLFLPTRNHHVSLIISDEFVNILVKKIRDMCSSLLSPLYVLLLYNKLIGSLLSLPDKPSRILNRLSTPNLPDVFWILNKIEDLGFVF